MAADDNYLPYLAVTVKSIAAHSNKDNIYDIRVLNKGLAPYNIRKLRHMKFENVNLMLVNVDDYASKNREEFKLRLRDYYSESIYYRIFISDMYPRLKRAIYIDCDIILKRDIADLYFSDIGDNILGAVTDESVTSTPEFCDYVINWVGIQPEKYINSGVLLMNLTEYRKHRISERFTNLLKKYNFDTVAPDQDYLNYLCKDKIFYLDGRWNKQPRSENAPSADELYLIHYNFNIKPWHYRDVTYAESFWEIAMTTTVFDDLLGELSRYTDEDREKDGRDALKLLERAALLAKASGGFRETADLGD